MLRRPLSPWRALWLFALSLGTLGHGCPEKDVASGAAPLATAAPIPAATPTPGPAFAATVRPILEVRCAPCHNPGGRMYARLPFDEASVVAAHSRGVRRRLKGEDLQVLEAWLATLPPPTPGPEPAY